MKLAIAKQFTHLSLSTNVFTFSEEVSEVSLLLLLVVLHTYTHTVKDEHIHVYKYWMCVYLCACTVFT